MNYEQAKTLLEEKGQTQLLRYYDELDEAGKAKLLAAIENINWSFEDALNNPVDMSGKDRDIRPINGLRLAAIEKRKAEFEKLKKNLKKKADQTSKKLSNAFKFCEEIFAEGQEILIFVTEMTINYYSAYFISRYGCKEYFKHNKELLFYERQKEIIRNIEMLDLD